MNEKSSSVLKYTHYVHITKTVCFCNLKGMNFIQGTNHHQTYFVTLDEQVGADNLVRLIDGLLASFVCKN